MLIISDEVRSLIRKKLKIWRGGEGWESKQAINWEIKKNFPKREKIKANDSINYLERFLYLYKEVLKNETYL